MVAKFLPGWCEQCWDVVYGAGKYINNEQTEIKTESGARMNVRGRKRKHTVSVREYWVGESEGEEEGKGREGGSRVRERERETCGET